MQAEPRTLEDLNHLIVTAKPMVRGSSRAILGEGPTRPLLALIGEQPGDQEDLQGRPFVGPAGKILNHALHQAGIERNQVYVTNAVKHFKFEQRGKRRLHRKPTAPEVKKYRWWLTRELDLVRPWVTVALGATATLALAGKMLPIGKNRGPAEIDGRRACITIHPSGILRIPNRADRDAAFADFVADLKAAIQFAQKQKSAPQNAAKRSVGKHERQVHIKGHPI